MEKVQNSKNVQQMYSHIFAGDSLAVTVAFKEIDDNLVAYGIAVVAPVDANRASKAKGRAIAGARCNAAMVHDIAVDWDFYYGRIADANPVLVEVQAEGFKKFGVAHKVDLKNMIRHLRAHFS